MLADCRILVKAVADSIRYNLHKFYLPTFGVGLYNLKQED